MTMTIIFCWDKTETASFVSQSKVPQYAISMKTFTGEIKPSAMNKR